MSNNWGNIEKPKKTEYQRFEVHLEKFGDEHEIHLPPKKEISPYKVRA
jgi:hypothetical protein